MEITSFRQTETVLSELPPELVSARTAAVYAGVTPRQKQSGSSVRGRTSLNKTGNSRLRKALYFPAITALKWNPLIREMGQRLLARGKSKMCVVGAAMRKLLHLIYGVLKHQKPFKAEECNQLCIELNKKNKAWYEVATRLFKEGTWEGDMIRGTIKTSYTPPPDDETSSEEGGTPLPAPLTP